ncbi:MAG: M48 family metallopeptidase [Deltaproteobacteria bacterium]|nr:M48 family metallopeptidase [Deltaproteobacteria bacterium]
MNFFERQDHARSRTSTLLLLLALAVAGTALAGYFITKLALILAFAANNQNVRSSGSLLSGSYHLHASANYNLRGSSPTLTEVIDHFAGWYKDPLLFLIGAATLALIAAGTVFQSLRLMGGGAVVAKLMGGRLVEPSTKDADERKLLNLVEEMSLASGSPVPTVYVMDSEQGINAFAAGHTPTDATITISKGCLVQLTRDELQGVIGHEFSHIFNGDMSLNMRLTSILFGILLIGKLGMAVTRNLPTRSSSSDRGGGGYVMALLLFGVLLSIVGFTGFFFGRLLKAAISRQREFLADASSVQFTRNPLGIGGALLKIRAATQGSQVKCRHAEDASHMFFADAIGSSWLEMLDTHPSLDERIKAISPALVNETVKLRSPAPAASAVGTPAARSTLATSDFDGLSLATMAGFQSQSPLIRSTPNAVVATIGTLSQENLDQARGLLDSLPPGVRALTQLPDGARGIVYALFMEPLTSAAPSILEKQLQLLATAGEKTAIAHAQQIQKLLPVMGDRLRVPLVDLCVPMLKRMIPEGRANFLDTITKLVHSDSRVDLFEFALQTILVHRLSPTPIRAGRVKFNSLQPLAGDIALVLSLLAFAGQNSPTEAQPAFQKAAAELNCGTLAMAQPKDCVPAKLNAALANLLLAAPLVKEQIIHAFVGCVLFDGKVTVHEAEVLRAITESMDCPMPPLLSTAATA